MWTKLFLFGASAVSLLAGCGKHGPPTEPDPYTPPVQYAISVASTTRGSVGVTADDIAVEQAVAGTRITITATPDEGYEFVKWTVTGVAPDNETAHVATFEMPENDITVTAEFREDDGPVVAESVEINGITWSTRNVDMPGTFAPTTESAGMFYQWGRRVGWSSTNPLINSDGGTAWDGSDYAGDGWTAANDPSPEGWRLPTRDEMNTLLDKEKVTREWSASPAGYTFTETATGNAVFFPAAGYRFNTDGVLDYAGSFGWYWSASPDGPANAYRFSFFSEFVSPIFNGSRSYGFSLRPVAEE